MLRTNKKLLENIACIKTTVMQMDVKMLDMSNQMQALKMENMALKEQVDKVTSTNLHLSEKIEDLEKYTRKDDLIIGGIPAPLKETHNNSKAKQQRQKKCYDSSL